MRNNNTSLHAITDLTNNTGTTTVTVLNNIPTYDHVGSHTVLTQTGGITNWQDGNYAIIVRPLSCSNSRNYTRDRWKCCA